MAAKVFLARSRFAQKTATDISYILRFLFTCCIEIPDQHTCLAHSRQAASEVNKNKRARDHASMKHKFCEKVEKGADPIESQLPVFTVFSRPITGLFPSLLFVFFEIF